MTNPELLKRIYLLRDKAELNKLVIFVGAGVSRNVSGLPSWNDLVIKMAESIGYSKCNLCSRKNDCNNRCDKCSNKDSCENKCVLINDFSSDEYLKIPQYVYNKKKSLYTEVLQNCITDNAIHDAPLSKAIFEINPDHIITTNYDKLLESSNSEFCRQYDVIVTDKDLLNAEKSKYIIKMHGDISQLDTIVLKEQDYLEYSQKHVLIELFVKALLSDHTILFLGYSLNDYNIKLILSWINYLRSQNVNSIKGETIGYIVLDEESDNTTTTNYFKKNNIEVINIHKLPLVNDIPDSLTSAKGKRLYSFLDIIKDPDHEKGLSSRMSIEKAVGLMLAHRVTNYTTLLKLLRLGQYEKKEFTLELYDQAQYVRLVSILNDGSDTARKLKQLFVNVGICSIINTEADTRHYEISIDSSDILSSDTLYTLYSQNKYGELLNACKAEKESIKKWFYQHFAIGYAGAFEEYSQIDFESLSEDDKVVFLHNMAVLATWRRFPFDFNSRKVQNYINNISSKEERQLFQPYIDIYEGNTKKRLNMHSSLTKLKERILSGPGSIYSDGRIGEIYRIKNTAIAQYLFYYCNHIFVLGFNDLQTFFRPYIEAVLLANCDAAEKPSEFMGMYALNQKYSVTTLDFDIISKYITTKDLRSIMSASNITQLNTSNESTIHVVSCFINMVDSLIDFKTYGHSNSSITVLVNIALLMSKMELDGEEKQKLSDAIERLFCDDEFNARFWNTSCPDFRDNIRVFSTLLDSLPDCSNISSVNSIVSARDFYTCAVNCGFNNVRGIIRFFLQKEGYDRYKEQLYSIIDGESDNKRKILLLRLFYKNILEEEKKKEYQAFLSRNFAEINTSAIIEFVFNGWLELSIEDVSVLKKSILDLYKNRNDALHRYPDPFKTELECIILLYITEKIQDISDLDELSDENDYLKFLLHPDLFEYSKVDFSNYMWENFARREQYMKLFVDHKNDIFPYIKPRIKEGTATEVEKKIFYGFLLEGDEIWNV